MLLVYIPQKTVTLHIFKSITIYYFSTLN